MSPNGGIAHRVETRPCGTNRLRRTPRLDRRGPRLTSRNNSFLTRSAICTDAGLRIHGQTLCVSDWLVSVQCDSCAERRVHRHEHRRVGLRRWSRDSLDTTTTLIRAKTDCYKFAPQ